MEDRGYILPTERGVDDHEYARFLRKQHPPRVVIDNDVCSDATVIRVDSINIHGILLQVVQVIADLHLNITKAYISSDGNWFMEVFHVIDGEGNKVMDERRIAHIQMTLESDDCYFPTIGNSVGIVLSKDFTTIELTGTDRPGLLSEICAVLADHGCNVNNADVWTHNMRVAAVLHVTDKASGTAIEDQSRISNIRNILFHVVKACGEAGMTRSEVSTRLTHKERRLHQMMWDDRNWNSRTGGNLTDSEAVVTVTNCAEKGYTIVILKSKDRPKLLFDAVCTLTDMQYVVHHGTVSRDGAEAYQEYYIRHANGHPVRSEAERQHVIQCLREAIERRTSEGLELELKCKDDARLLSTITRTFREHGLTIRRAEISTINEEVMDTFYVSEPTGNKVEPWVIDAIISEIERSIRGVELRVKHSPFGTDKPTELTSTTALLIGTLIKFYRPFQSLLGLELQA